ncbi:hypothetical protein CCB80_09975 [Armatimonadetes bacterium Uphvl-Ar1]|nr:hypothetical protein CCB80_09975 [Armatimonadetes bacterium Uphvl-Ar1]
MEFQGILNALTSGPGMVGGLVGYLLVCGSLFIIAQQEREEFAWFAFVPILNLFLMCKIGKVNPLLLLLFFVPCVGFLMLGYLWAKIGEPRGKALLGWLCVIPCCLYFCPLIIALDKK